MGAAAGHGAVGKVHLSGRPQKKWAKITPLSPFSSCPRISQSGQGARAALCAALWPDPGRPSARPGRPFGPPLVLRAGLAARRAARRAEGPPFRPRGPPFHRARVEGLGKRVRPVAVAAMAASAVMVKLDSAALEIAGAWLAKREDDVADGERVNAHSAQVAHAALLPRVRG